MMGDGLAIVSDTDQDAVILVVDDDAEMRTLLAALLRDNGYVVDVAANGDEMQEKLAKHDVRLMLLDVMMPGMNGFDICRQLRAGRSSHLPIIMISARGTEADRVVGLELGADDYISKPFGQSEVIARIRAVMRRTAASPFAAAPTGSVQADANTKTDVKADATSPVLRAAGQSPRGDILSFAGFRLDQRRRQLFAASGAAIILSAGEFDMLANLAAHPLQVVTRDTLLQLSRFRVPGSSDRSVDVIISRLRGKLGDANDAPLIRTVRGHGYILMADVVAQ
jgi:two-component system, OmpR family, response regulator